LKPDAVERGLVGTIIARFEAKGLRIAALDQRSLDKETLARHYEEHVGKGFYADLVAFMSRGPVVAMVVEGDENTWEVVRNKFRVRKKNVKFPSIVEILLRASMLASSRRQDDAVKSADLVFHPPIDEFGLLEFDAIERLEQVGYEHAKQQIEAWRTAGAL